MKAVILVKSRIPGATFDLISKLQGIEEIKYVTGPYDLLVTIGHTNDLDLGRIALSVQTCKYVTQTMTCSVIREKIF